VEEAMEEAARYPDKEIYVIGGGSIYKQFLPYVDTVYVTRIDKEYEADTFFPDLDKDPGWEISEESEEQTYFDLIYTYVTYVRKK
jgi:dihydrofolate reductase